MSLLFTYVDHLDADKELFCYAAKDILLADQAFKQKTGTDPNRKGIGIRIQKSCLPYGTEIAIHKSPPDWLMPKVRSEAKTVHKIVEQKPITHAAERLAVNWLAYIEKQAKAGVFLNKKCFYCGIDCRPLRSIGICEHDSHTRDHIHPKSRGGKHKVPACNRCNQRKGALSLEEFRLVFFAGIKKEFFAEYAMRTGRIDFRISNSTRME